ncbi:MAG TPA: proton-conducting transporter membrane subunit, partial [Myxococcota bacterium]|nr:proton-conducting transporter membrane subunit [Myxococcota bacterium]
RDAVTFLMAWEAMTLSSFFLVTAEGESSSRPGLVYLLASQLGVAPLFAMFTLLSAHAGATGFDAMGTAGAPGAWTAAAAFLLALVGFGAKAGFWPLHVWLPEAHPAAPSHVSAAMSGVMIKMGVYGLLRTLAFLGTPPPWWGLVLLGVGATSGIGGVLHALAQHDLKRLLAYHSVENLGIIALGLGLGLLGLSAGNATVAALGLGGALLHVLGRMAGSQSEAWHTGLDSDLVDDWWWPLERLVRDGRTGLWTLALLGERLAGRDGADALAQVEQASLAAASCRFIVSPDAIPALREAVETRAPVAAGFAAPTPRDVPPADCRAGRTVRFRPFDGAADVRVFGLPGATVAD